MSRFLLYSVASCALLFVGSCGSSTSSSKPKSGGITKLDEKAVAQQEAAAGQARQCFYRGRYAESAKLLEPLCQVRTASQPLYLCELGTAYLALNDKANAKRCLMEAYSSIEGFFDPASEKQALSLWGAEVGKVYKGDPYEQATLCLLTGLLLLEEGDVDNALACFKSGQVADSDVKEERFQCDYGLLQMMEAKCYTMRSEAERAQEFVKIACNAFADTHPWLLARRAEIERDSRPQAAQVAKNKKRGSRDPKGSDVEDRVAKEWPAMRTQLLDQNATYYQSLLQPYNTLLLVWSGQSPAMERAGQYGEHRMIVKRPGPEYHFEANVDGSSWFDVIRGFADISYQATTRGGREMDNVLADKAAFKDTSYRLGKSFFDSARDASDARAAAAMMLLGMVAYGVGSAANSAADIRCWLSLPGQIAVVPLQLTPGIHQVRVDCYDNKFRKQRTVEQSIVITERPFQFYNIVVPVVIPARDPNSPPEPKENPPKV